MQSTSRLMPLSDTGTPASREYASDSPARTFALAVVGGCCGDALMLAALLAQLIRYQLFPTAEEQTAGPATVMDTRGSIVDRNGTPLVVNRYSFQLTVTPAHIKTP